MAGQSVDNLLKDGIPDGAFTMSYFAEGTEIADAVIGIAPVKMVVLKAWIGVGTAADGACTAHVKQVPSGTAINQAGQDITTASFDLDASSGGGVSANSTAELTLVTASGVPDANTVEAGDRLVLDLGSDSTALTAPHVTVLCMPFNTAQA
tara:strand:+ start:10706 stop:11158 length:453 start_codon:yes stop_codon:yes gene_type:complete